MINKIADIACQTKNWQTLCIIQSKIKKGNWERTTFPNAWTHSKNCWQYSYLSSSSLETWVTPAFSVQYSTSCSATLKSTQQVIFIVWFNTSERKPYTCCHANMPSWLDGVARTTVLHPTICAGWQTDKLKSNPVTISNNGQWYGW